MYSRSLVGRSSGSRNEFRKSTRQVTGDTSYSAELHSCSCSEDGDGGRGLLLRSALSCRSTPSEPPHMGPLQERCALCLVHSCLPRPVCNNADNMRCAYRRRSAMLTTQRRKRLPLSRVNTFILGAAFPPPHKE